MENGLKTESDECCLEGGMESVKLGILALQGSFREHADCFMRLGIEPVLVRLPEQLVDLHGLIIPGGESTTIGRLMKRYGFIEPIIDMARAGLPVYGTCAGMILLARGGSSESVLSLMDIWVKRNAFGRQQESFETDLRIPLIGQESFRGVFIRAPWIEKIGSAVRVLARLEDGTAVAVEQNNLLASAFHPELTTDLRIHRYFLGRIKHFCRNQSTGVHRGYPCGV